MTLAELTTLITKIELVSGAKLDERNTAAYQPYADQIPYDAALFQLQRIVDNHGKASFWKILDGYRYHIIKIRMGACPDCNNSGQIWTTKGSYEFTFTCPCPVGKLTVPRQRFWGVEAINEGYQEIKVAHSINKKETA